VGKQEGNREKERGGGGKEIVGNSRKQCENSGKKVGKQGENSGKIGGKQWGNWGQTVGKHGENRGNMISRLSDSPVSGFKIYSAS
jgi:hypothetical protein